MVMIEIKKYKFYMDKNVKKNLDIIKNKAIPKKWDAVFIVNGMEGAGKTTFAAQCALYLDPTFNLDRCVFTSRDFLKAIDEAPPESSILWDEAIRGAKVNQHASTISQSIVNKLTMIRKKRLKIFACFPYLYMLNKYFVSRCISSFYIYALDFDKRGYLKMYSKNQTELIYDMMKIKYKYNHRSAYYKVRGMMASFGKTFCLPELEYEDKKDKATLEGDKKMPPEEFWVLVHHVCKKKKWMAQRDVGEMINIPQSTISTKIRNIP